MSSLGNLQLGNAQLAGGSDAAEIPDLKVAWRIRTDFNGNGSFSDEDDNITDRVLLDRGFSATRGRDPARAMGQPLHPAFDFTLDNEDRKFSTDFAGSPYFNKEFVSKTVDCAAIIGDRVPVDAHIPVDSHILVDGASAFPLFTGQWDDFKHNLDWSDRTTSVKALGPTIRLSDRGEVSTTTTYTDILTSVAVGYILDLVSWPSDKRSIAGCAVTLKQWWLSNENPWSALIALMNTEGPGSALYIDGDGVLHFEGQTYRADTPRCITPQQSFTPRGELDGYVYLAEPGHDRGKQDIINDVKYRWAERQLMPNAEIWRSPASSISIPAGQTKTIIFETANPWESPSPSPYALVAGTDYILSSGTITTATVTKQTCTRGLITLTASVTAVVTNLLVRALSWAVVQENDVTSVISAPASQLIHGVKPFTIAGRAEIDANMAVSICDTTILRYQQERPVNRFAIIGYNGNKVYEALARQISDRIHFEEYQTGQNFDAWIEYLEYRVQDNLLVTIVGCEKAIFLGYGRYDTALYDTDVYGQ